MEHVQICRYVVLVRVARGLAIFSEERIILVFCNYICRQFTVELEPLRAFPPLIQHDLGGHAPAIATATLSGVLIVRLDKAVGRIYEVLVDRWEIIHWNAAFREQNKALIREIQQSIGQETLLSIYQCY